MASCITCGESVDEDEAWPTTDGRLCCSEACADSHEHPFDPDADSEEVRRADYLMDFLKDERLEREREGF